MDTLPPIIREVENGPRKETKVIFQAPIFHFRDYGRKSIINHEIRVFPKNKATQNGWFIMETPIKIHDLGVYTTIFWKHP